MASGKGLILIMTKADSQTIEAPYWGATPITLELLQQEFEPTIDRCAAGETFVVLVAGEPTVYMVPYDQYQALVKRAEAT